MESSLAFSHAKLKGGAKAVTEKDMRQATDLKERPPTPDRFRYDDTLGKTINPYQVSGRDPGLPRHNKKHNALAQGRSGSLTAR